jgi:hypothetical protein
MKGHARLPARTWMLPLGVLILIAGHVIFFNRLRHTGVSLAVVSGLALLAIAKHLGVLGSLYTLFRRRFLRSDGLCGGYSNTRPPIVGSEEARAKRWPPSAAQTARTVFPYAAFTKTQRHQDAREGIK